LDNPFGLSIWLNRKIKSPSVSQKSDTDVADYNYDWKSTNFNYFWQRRCWDSMLSKGNLLSHLSASLHYLGKQEPRKLCLVSHAVYCVSNMQWLGEK